MEGAFIWFVVILVCVLAIVYIHRQAPSPVYIQREDPLPPLQDAPALKDAKPAVDELAAFFPPVTPEVPADYPRKSIGDCPYSRAQKTQLPLIDAPMCIMKI